ncbi:hypothetical protein [Janthinobacterium sp. 78]|uniref:hypothetical protein n=1 Tax=Janthinobacterium sp. 78 TaxID=2135631 RepID=UPI001FAF1AA7|nr:hypothetical protein [Janthinobacterium sp. 78]
MRKLNATVLTMTCAAALCACQSPSPAASAQPLQIPPLPQAISTKRAPNLTQRLRQLLTPLPATATTPPAS